MTIQNQADRGDAKPFHVLVVCYGNICRSPVAEALLRKAVGEAGLASGVSVASAGVRALEGHGAAAAMRALAAAHGVSLDAHVARQLTRAMAHAADAIIALDELVEEEILILSGNGVDVHLWPVDDPYGGPEAGYARAYAEIEGHVHRFVEALPSLLRFRQ